MRLLVVSAFYSPHQNPRAFRWTTVAETLARSGCSVHVICGPAGNAPCRERLRGVEVERVGSHLLPGFAVGPASGAGPSRTAARALLRGVYQATWKRVYWPDYLCLWFPSALAAARRALGRTPFDALVTVSLPFTSHLVGLALKRTRLSLRWLADIGDPFSLMEDSPINNYALYGGLNRRVERDVLRRADAVSVTTEGLRREYGYLFPGAAARIHVIPPVLATLGDGEWPTAALRGPASPVRFVYVGTLYKGIRSPIRALEIFDALQRRLARPLEFHFFGIVHDAAEQFARFQPLVGRSVFLHGTVSRDKALAEMRAADVLVNIGNTTSFQVPSKLVEYIHAGRPIINLCWSETDTSLELLRDHPAVHHWFADRPNDDRAIARLASFVEYPPIVTEDALRVCMARFLPQGVAYRYQVLLNDTSP